MDYVAKTPAQHYTTQGHSIYLNYLDLLLNKHDVVATRQCEGV